MAAGMAGMAVLAAEVRAGIPATAPQAEAQAQVLAVRRPLAVLAAAAEERRPQAISLALSITRQAEAEA
jgi:hypothetical protein